MRVRIRAVASWVVLGWACCARAGAEPPAAVGFAVGKPVCYEIRITDERPGVTRTTTNYVKYRPSAVSPDGQVTLRYDWGTGLTTEGTGDTARTRTGRPPAFLSGPQPADDHPAAEVVIDRLGNVLRVTGGGVSQLDNLLGPVYGLLLLPLPPAGQTAWTTHRPVTVYNESVQKDPGGMWGSHDVTTRVEHASQETVTYTLGTPADGKQTVRRAYELASDEKAGDVPVDRLSGSGEYTVDAAGLVQTYEARLTNELNEKNVSVKVPITISAHRLSGDELAKIKADNDAYEAERAAETAKREQERAIGASDVHDLPAGLTKTAMVGGHGGGEFTKVNASGLPVIGFRVRLGGWGGHKVIGEIEPLYQKPADAMPADAKAALTKPKPAGREETIVLARDGYAVGGVWVNATDNADAIRPIFMKKTATGLDPKAAYVGPWVGELQGPGRTRLGGTGKFVMGTFGRKGLNTDAFGLVMQEADPTDDPSFKPAAPADPTDDPNFKGTPAAKP